MKEIFIRHWFERPGRFFLILLGLMTATTAIVAVLCASYNARASYNRLNQLASGIPAIDIHQRRGERFDPSTMADLKLPFEINAKAPMLFRGTIARQGAERLRCILLGIPLAEGGSDYYNATNREALLSYLDAADVSAIGSNECLVSENASSILKLEVGSEVQLLFRRKIQKLTVRKVVPNEAWQAFAVEPSIIVDLNGLQQWSGLAGQVDRIRYFVNDTDEEVKEASAQALGLMLKDDLTASVRTSAFGSAASIFRSAELGLSFATTLAGAMSLYILLNTIRMNFLERRRQFAILRCIGATPGQIFFALIVETATLSLLASGIGLIVGILLGRLLQDVLLNMTNAAPSTYLIPWLPVGVVAAIIPLCSLMITTIAYWEQRDVSPLENFRESPQAASARFPLLVVLSGLGLWFIAFVGLLAVQREQVPYGWAIPAGLVMVIAYLLFLPLGWIPLLAVLSYFNRKGQWFGVDLAKYQLTRRTERTSLSAGFLVIALCGAIGLGQALMSNIAELRRWYKMAFAGDIFLVGVPSQVNDSDDPIRTTLLAKSPDPLQWVDTIRFIDMEIEGVSVSSIIREFPEAAPFPGVLKDIEQPEAIQQLRAGKLMLNAIVAKRLGKKAGDKVLLQHAGQGLEFEVAGTFVDFRNGGMSILLERRAAQDRFLVTGFDLMAIQCPEADRPAVTQEIQNLEGANSMRIISGSELRADIDATISSVILGITLVVVTSFVIGGLGIMSTMAMNVAEQTKDFALLRLVGMVRGQVLRSVLIQGLLLGLIGSIFGWIGGTTTAWIIHACSEAILGYTPQFDYSIRLPLISIAGTMIVVVLASLIPAYQATRVDPKQSLQYED
ncbi:MAG: FtsX-like permease family protein [Pirellula sp.]|jgi:putative ABC transport system permease protein|nr:FtsX-like permease family protein [Pirellula sp.]